MVELSLTAVKLNGDSSAHSVSYAEGQATCIWEDADGSTYRLTARTDTLFSEASGEQGSVHLKIETLAHTLLIDEASGRYCAPPDFGRQMQLVRQGYQLVLGRKRQEWPYLLRIRGYCQLLVCPLRAHEDVRLLPVDQVGSDPARAGQKD